MIPKLMAAVAFIILLAGLGATGILKSGSQKKETL
jgi:hypothetical protein